MDDHYENNRLIMADKSGVEEILESLFTAVIRLDSDLRIQYVSPLIGRYAPEVRCGQEFSEAFELIRPRNLSKSSLAKKQKMIFLLVSRASRYPIRGQLVQISADFYLFGSPWLSRMTEDQLHQYELSDFPPHDAQLDWLFMLSAEKQQVKDLQRLSEKLEVARAEAEAATESKSNFFAVISHEVRTPLNAIIGSVDLLSGSKLGAEQQELLAISTNAAQQLLSIINDVLDFSKMEAGKLEIENVACTLRDIVDDSIALLTPRANEKGVSIQIEDSPVLGEHVFTDSGKIKQILLNFLSNAIKFTEEGTVSVRALEISREPTGIRVRISVVDTGIGISESDQEKLFQQFWTSSIEQGYQGRGTGLGLNIAKRLTQLLEGSIGSNSTLGEGSEFWVELPLELRSNTAAPESRTDGQDEKLTEVCSGKKVLVAEDNKANQVIARLSLEKLGMEVTIANNGLEALEALISSPFDVVLMDIGMPELNGIETTFKIRNELQMRDLPIIACTAHTLSTAQGGGENPGFDAYVAKPIDRQKLIDTLLGLLSKAPNTGQLDTDSEGSQSTNSEIISLQDLERLRSDIGEENMKLAVEVLISEIENRSNTIRKARDKADFPDLAEQAHALKSSALSFGATKLAEVLKTLELKAKESDPNALELVDSVLVIAEESRIAYSNL